MHSRPPRTVSERTRNSCPSEILTTSAALGSSAMVQVRIAGVSPVGAQGGTHAKLCLELEQHEPHVSYMQKICECRTYGF